MEAYNDLTKIYKRIFWGKVMGFVLASIGVLILIFAFDYSISSYFLWGIVLWYTTIGGLVGIMGILDYHPLFKMHLYLWRGLLLGGFMNVILTFFIYDIMINMLNNATGILVSTCTIFVGLFFEGAIIGLVIDYFMTKKFGEGKELLKI